MKNSSIFLLREATHVQPATFSKGCHMYFSIFMSTSVSNILEMSDIYILRLIWTYVSLYLRYLDCKLNYYYYLIVIYLSNLSNAVSFVILIVSNTPGCLYVDMANWPL
ncbi:hypothetical protein GDO78_001027 [Eleutherodactylus coqui]|uniref:Uncharacterized protein n=1 Tax=Eleutherodactylus coqui TaxID=57060 RepID=A0A8J6FSS7_ELECQ|nr:hypothetical protein GDO78_001027 [Eleutherodactylus coqui]